MAKLTADREPLASYWTAIRSKNPDLAKNPAFKPDITGPIKTYDAGLTNYGKLVQEHGQLMDLFPPYNKVLIAFNEKIGQLYADRDKTDESFDAQHKIALSGVCAEIAKQENADSVKLSGLLADLYSSSEDSTKIYAQTNAQLDKTKQERLAATRKIRDDYKEKSTVIAAGMKKIDDDTIRLEGQIRGIIANYKKIATQLAKDDIGDAVSDLLSHF
jgi:hypothetical protein